MRVCIIKATKHILEMQSSAIAGTLIQNAVNAGYAPDMIEEREVTDAEYKVLMANDPVEIALNQAQAEKALLDELIQAKLKTLAIDALKKEGKLTAEGKVIK